MEIDPLSMVWNVLKSVLAHPAILNAGPALDLFLLQYMRKFRIQEVGGNLIVHSHLPPLNSEAYGRFVREHLSGKCEGPSHAQIGVTNACPQRCAYCYNRDREGSPLQKPAILKAIAELKDMGVVWLGLTGGEPLLNRDLVEIVERASGGCAVKLFTTGSTLTPRLADALRKAGLFSVSVSLDHWNPEIHDRVRNHPGAFRTALRAIEAFKDAGLHTGVSAVLSKEMIAAGQTPQFLDFLEGLGIHEAWLSETKPSTISGDERRTLMELQDRRNRTGHMTVNYLGHFEAGEHFGCNAGRKMVYVDAFGDVSPCVFVPMAFGNVGERPLRDIWRDMRDVFRPSSACFINRNYSAAELPAVKFGPPSRFAELYSRRYHGRLP